MPVVRGIVAGLASAALMIAVAACRPALATVSGTPGQADVIVWGRVPYCNCLAGSATANVAGALKDAGLTVNLKELSPRDGWLYFAVTFDPHSATWDQVSAAVVAGGGEVIEGPP